ncbi:MAG TPA: peroxide stress protein YaaA [Methanoregulaceae archaeon]|nr:MAG: peroxide stress protein YaaA [Methanolinea sp.]HPD09540.1 peroxide stress protein YaaA [Methanoregulaceae archaeon]
MNKATVSSDEPYHKERSIAARLKDPQAIKLLYQARNLSFDLIFKGGLENKGSSLAEHPLNLGLHRSQDFNGKASAKYLPAIDRYIGRFYSGKGNDGKIYDLKTSLEKSPHHLLIISGLYGLLLPEEQIQLYESPLEDLQEIQEIWKTDNRLTCLLAAYARAEGIKLVVDMTGQRAYQQLIDWSAIEGLKDVRVLHAMGKIGPGEDQIKTFAAALCDSLLRMPAPELLALPDSWMLETHHLMLRKILSPPKGENWPKEPTPIDEFAESLLQFINQMPTSSEESVYSLFVHRNAMGLLSEMKRKQIEWRLSVHPHVRKDIDSYDNPHIKRLFFQKMQQVLMVYPISRKMKEITETGRIKEFTIWRLRIADYRLHFCTDETNRFFYIFRFEKKSEDEQTYDYSNLDASTLRRLMLREK